MVFRVPDVGRQTADGFGELRDAIGGGGGGTLPGGDGSGDGTNTGGGDYRLLEEIEYTYDGFDRRLTKKVTEPVEVGPAYSWKERYVYDSVPGSGLDHVVMVLDAYDNFSVKKRFLHGPIVDQVFAEEDGSTGNVMWMLTDNQGTVRDVVDSSGGSTSVVNHLQYDGFGNITDQSNEAFEPTFTYTGRAWDADAELYYYRARWYDPVAGRFVSEDPIGFAGGDANLFGMVGNSTPNGADPSGLTQVDLESRIRNSQRINNALRRAGKNWEFTGKNARDFFLGYGRGFGEDGFIGDVKSIPDAASSVWSLWMYAADKVGELCATPLAELESAATRASVDAGLAAIQAKQFANDLNMIAHAVRTEQYGMLTERQKQIAIELQELALEATATAVELLGDAATPENVGRLAGLIVYEAAKVAVASGAAAATMGTASPAVAGALGQFGFKLHGAIKRIKGATGLAKAWDKINDLKARIRRILKLEPKTPPCKSQVPPIIYREGRNNVKNFTPRDGDEGLLSFRDSLSNPTKPGVPGPLHDPARLDDPRAVLRPGKDFVAIDTAKLPEGSVIDDGVPGSYQTPSGHVSVDTNLAGPEQIKQAVIPKPPIRKGKPIVYGPDASGKLKPPTNPGK